MLVILVFPPILVSPRVLIAKSLLLLPSLIIPRTCVITLLYVDSFTSPLILPHDRNSFELFVECIRKRVKPWSILEHRDSNG